MEARAGCDRCGTTLTMAEIVERWCITCEAEPYCQTVVRPVRSADQDSAVCRRPVKAVRRWR